MISGYFSISKTNFNLNKFLIILFEIYTYYYPSLYIDKKIRTINKNLKMRDYSNIYLYCPLLTRHGNWFIQIYLLFLIFTPFINTGLLSLNKKKYKDLVILIIIFYCILNPIDNYFNFDSIIFATTHFIRLLLSYIIGGYINLYDLEYKYIWIIIGKFYFIITILSEIIFDRLALSYKNYNFILFKTILSFNINSLISVLGSMGLIYLFKNINFYNKKINCIAASVFGIYLIHGNKNLSPYIYNVWFKTNDINDSLFFVKYIIKGMIIISVSIIIDLIRRYTIGLLFIKLLIKIKN